MVEPAHESTDEAGVRPQSSAESSGPPGSPKFGDHDAGDTPVATHAAASPAENSMLQALPTEDQLDLQENLSRGWRGRLRTDLLLVGAYVLITALVAWGLLTLWRQ